MVASRFIAIAFITAASASLVAESDVFTALLKRQEPGTPAYNCHDNCGTAITVSREGGDVCTNEIFLYDYQNCLQCAGPDNYNIWRYYGATLSTVAEGCGLDTEPLSGEQADVPEAMHPGDSASSSTPAPSSSTPTPTGESSAPVSETPAPTSEVPESTAEVTPSVTVSGSPTPSGNGTATFTSSAPPQQSVNAAANFGAVDNALVMLGAAVAGAMYGFGN
ncbi:hypothetical protein BU26DRAFT_600816 [Trematosphaeria pertusa]|uniref:Uncharacterized protein n=1 Tax=Trematosphaeria pertusa TaxID=390896 RepID=A0A6A6IZE3_9PLEO|nr:uncharacterized protein BU26DRAFT_600816 [Trematosphaeria pertusa]KAF2255282.1 hypothetical protein BU26DRAFT_600816 [Trematosphaeria pertusa]